MNNGEQFFNTAAGGGYAIERSLRFNAPDSSFLSRTPASAGNRKTWTWAGWVKRSKLGSTQYIISAGADGSNNCALLFTGSDTLELFSNVSGSYDTRKITSQVFRDASSWYHIVVANNSSTSTKVYINGLEVTSFSTNTNSGGADWQFNATSAQNIGRWWNTGSHLDAYLADIHFIDGQALDPTSFGEFSATTGVWMPKAYSGSYGTNGFHLDFSDNSTAAALGTDTSGNGNTWSVSNLSVTAGAGNDSLVDVPTNGSEVDTGAGGEVRGNYCTLNPLINISGHTFSNGNLQVVTSSSNYGTFASTVAAPPSGKWYAEALISATSGYPLVGIAGTGCTFGTTSYLGGQATMYAYYGVNGNKYNNGTSSSYGATYGAGDIIGIAYDADAGTITFYKNGVSQGQAYSSITSGSYYFAGNEFNNASGTQIWNFGQRPFAYTAPSGFKALNTANLPAPVITKPSDVMDVKLYTGTGTTNNITGLAFSPDFIWLKSRSTGQDNNVFDAVRGPSSNLYALQTNSTGAEGQYGTLGSLNSDGFTLTGAGGATNASGTTYVAWAWDAGSSTVTNTQGSISSQVRANASAGFSVVTWTGTGSSATVGHGLGIAPAMVITKRRDAAGWDWPVWHAKLTSGVYSLFINNTNAEASRSDIWSSAPSSSVFNLGNSGQINGSSGTYVAYCFAPVAGYSSFGSYTGNGSTDGPFVYTGFRPRWVLIKQSSASGENWRLFDTSRDPYNVSQNRLIPNLSAAEAVGVPNELDILSNGFKFRATDSASNGSGATYIYAAFAESPFQYARAR